MPPRAQGRSWPQLVLDAAGWLLLAIGLWATLQSVWAPLGYFDEGILLSDGHFLRHGLAAYRDFYTQYPPGAPLLVAALWSLTGVSALSVRWLGLVVRLAFVLLCGCAAGRLAGRRFSPLAAGLVAHWMAILALPPYGWRLALASSVLFLELFELARRRVRVWLFACAGAALGAVGLFRHDLFGFLAAGFFLYAIAPRGWLAWLSVQRPARSALLTTACGALVVLSLMWLPVVLLAGLDATLADLVFDQAAHVLPARHLPFPTDLLHLVRAEPLPLPLPLFLTSPLRAAAALVVAAPFVAALLVWAIRRARQDATSVLLYGVLAVAVIPQLLGRTDRVHALSTLPPALVLASVALGRGPIALALAATIALAAPPFGDLWSPDSGPQESADASGRDAGLLTGDPAVAAARRELLAYLRSHTGSDERVLFGNATHRDVYANEADLYFLADRLPATRYAQYDPDIVSRAEVQSEMIVSLERSCTRVVVLSSRYPPRGKLEGAALLDDYIAAHYREGARFGPYSVRLRDVLAAGCPSAPLVQADLGHRPGHPVRVLLADPQPQ